MDRRREVEEDKSINKHMGLFAGKQCDERRINTKCDISFHLNWQFVFQQGTRANYQAKITILLIQEKRKREKRRRK